MTDLILNKARTKIGLSSNIAERVIVPHFEIDVPTEISKTNGYFDAPSRYKTRSKGLNLLSQISNKIQIFPSFDHTFMKQTMWLHDAVLDCEILAENYEYKGQWLLTRNWDISKRTDGLSPMHFEILNMQVCKDRKVLYSMNWESGDLYQCQ